MPTLGTKKFWIPALGASTTQKENQILKNSGYINIQLVSVNYMSKGNFFQNTFGGRDKIALATNLSYQKGTDSIQANSIQDVREVEVNRNYILGLKRNIAIKIPANADALAMEVKMTAIKDDLLQAKFEMLNKEEYQSALQLAPAIVGQVLTITSLTKKLFTDSEPRSQLDATYAGIISSQAEDNPVNNGRLTKGLLIMISTDDGESFSNVDESKFEIRGDALYYNKTEVSNTYIVFNITFDQFKGDDENSNWFNKYTEALNNLDRIHLTDDADERKKIFNDSKTYWIEGNALLDADITYINSEKIKLKGAAIKFVNEKYNSLLQPESFEAVSTLNIVEDLTKTYDFETIQKALPITGSHLNNTLESHSIEDVLENMQDNNGKFAEYLNKDIDDYLNGLKENNILFKLGEDKSIRQPLQSQPQDDLIKGKGLRENGKDNECDDYIENEDNLLEIGSCTSFSRPWKGKKWRVAKSLKVLLNQVNSLAPRRNNKSDGTIGDLAHENRDSDHNPWVLDKGGNGGIVTALDITHDPVKGCDCNALAKTLQLNKDNRIKYVIWNRQIMSSSVNPWTWRPYSGKNPHEKHLHISVYCDQSLCDSNDKWDIKLKPLVA